VDKEISEIEKKFIQDAFRYLENPGFLLKATQVIGSPLEKGLTYLPDHVQKSLSETTQRALEAALKTALSSLNGQPQTRDLHNILEDSRDDHFFHNCLTGATGAASGFFGLPALALELPITTTLMLRSIAQTAQAFGADLSNRETQLECLFVFSMGEPFQNNPLTESTYYSTRMVFAGLMREAAIFLATKGGLELAEILARGSAPILVRLLAQLAGRFQSVVAQKFLMQVLPLAGAVGGGTLNVLFMDHFNNVAKYHFGIQKLEREYGKEAVKRLYVSR